MVLQAYKDLSQVMANQQDLTEIVHRLQVPWHEDLMHDLVNGLSHEHACIRLRAAECFRSS